MTAKTVTIQLHTKDPDAWGEAFHALKVKASVRDKLVEFGEYATIELEVDKDLNVVKARIVPL